MPVTEIATLRLLSPYTWDSPDIQSFFEAVAVQQAAWSSYPLRFFQDTRDTRVVHLITGWESIHAHYGWIASEQNQKLLERTKGLLEVVGLEHAGLDSEAAHAPFVVWKQWRLQEGEAEIHVRGTGPVLDKEEGVVCSLKGYEEHDEAYLAGGDDKETIIMKRLVLNGGRGPIDGLGMIQGSLNIT